MNVQIRSLFFTICFLSISTTLLAQKTSDAKFIFKTWLFLDHHNTKSRDAVMFPMKDSSLFNLFQNGIELKFDTLRMTGFVNDYIFLAVSFMGKEILKDHSITYKIPQLIEYMGIPVDNCEDYIICINKSKGTSYRLKGFYGNDFLSLFHELQVNYTAEKSKELSIKQFLKSYYVEGLDFECLYKGLTSGDSDVNKYQCLKNCSDAILIVH